MHQVSRLLVTKARLCDRQRASPTYILLGRSLHDKPEIVHLTLFASY